MKTRGQTRPDASMEPACLNLPEWDMGKYELGVAGGGGQRGGGGGGGGR